MTTQRLASIQRTAAPELVPFSGLEAYQLGLQDGFSKSFDYAFAWQGVQETSGTLRFLLQSVVQVYLVTEGLPGEWQLTQLKNFLALVGNGQPVHKLIVMAVDNLRDAVSYYSSFEAVQVADVDVNREELKWLLESADELRIGIRTLMWPGKRSDGGKRLRDAITERGGPEFIAALNTMRLQAPRIGRKAGPTPVVKYVLSRTDELKSLHGGPPGAQMERLLHELKQRDDVKEWVTFKAKLSANKPGSGAPRIPEMLGIACRERSVEVQVYETYGELTRAEAGEKLAEMRKNHPNRQRG